jgi:hypothetical protein
MLTYLDVIYEGKRTKMKTALLGQPRHLNNLPYHKESSFQFNLYLHKKKKNWKLTVTDEVTYVRIILALQIAAIRAYKYKTLINMRINNRSLQVVRF